MPERIEEVLRAIHVLFSKGEMYHELQDKVVLPKREMFALLEQLNVAVVDVMDRYEATTRAKQKALKEVEEQGQKIMDAANKEAENIYAASILYTDGALNEFSNLVDGTRQRLRDEYAMFEQFMDEQLEQVKKNQEELLSRLQILSQNQKYLALIHEYSKRQEEEENSLQDKKNMGNQKNSNEKKGKQTKGNQKTEKNQVNDAIIPEKFKKNGKGMPQKEPITIGAALVETDEEEEAFEPEKAYAKVEVKVHTGGGIPENSIFHDNLFKTKKDRKREEKNKKKNNDKDAIDIHPDDIEEGDDIPFFTSEQLDAENEQWQRQQEQEKKTNENEENLAKKKSDRGFSGFFSRKKE